MFVADSQHILADALGRALAGEPDLDVVPVHPVNGIDAIAALVAHRPDVALLDYWLPGGHGATAVQMVRAWSPTQRVVLLSAVCSPEQVRGALDAGAVGFLPKSVTVDLVAEAVRRAQVGESPVFADRLERFIAELERRCAVQDVRVERLRSLTPREVTVLRHLGTGHSIVEVARELSVTQGTLRGHIHKILTKTGARSQLEAVAMARRERLIQDD